MQALRKSPGIIGGFDAFSYRYALSQEQLREGFI